MEVSEVQLLEYLTELCDKAYSYSVINTHKSAIVQTLLACGKTTLFKHPMISKLMKGAYNTIPPKRRYTRTWDVTKV